MPLNEAWVELHIGMENPRKPGEVGFRVHDVYVNAAEAEKEAKDHDLKLYRIVRCEVVKKGPGLARGRGRPDLDFKAGA